MKDSKTCRTVERLKLLTLIGWVAVACSSNGSSSPGLPPSSQGTSTPIAPGPTTPIATPTSNATPLSSPLPSPEIPTNPPTLVPTPSASTSPTPSPISSPTSTPPSSPTPLPEPSPTVSPPFTDLVTLRAPLPINTAAGEIRIIVEDPMFGVTVPSFTLPGSNGTALFGVDSTVTEVTSYLVETIDSAFINLGGVTTLSIPGIDNRCVRIINLVEDIEVGVSVVCP